MTAVPVPPLTDAELAEIDRLLEAADLTPLELSKTFDFNGDLVATLSDGTGVEARIYVEETADLIVAALNGLPRLVASLRAARAELRKLDPAKVQAWIADRDELAGQVATFEQENDRLRDEVALLRQDYAAASMQRDRAQAELERLQGNADILSCSTIGEAFDRIEEIIAERDEARAALARAEETAARVRKLHYEYEGRCVLCITWCDCDSDLEPRHQHNVEWPCPTVQALAADAPAAPSCGTPGCTFSQMRVAHHVRECSVHRKVGIDLDDEADAPAAPVADIERERAAAAAAKGIKDCTVSISQGWCPVHGFGTPPNAADAPAAPITRDGGDCTATIHGPACNGIHYAADPGASEPDGGQP